MCEDGIEEHWALLAVRVALNAVLSISCTTGCAWRTRGSAELESTVASSSVPQSPIYLYRDNFFRYCVPAGLYLGEGDQMQIPIAEDIRKLM
ncbi:hypothetical protein WAI453_005808 [Rhynchosporium graminicola]